MNGKITLVKPKDEPAYFGKIQEMLVNSGASVTAADWETLLDDDCGLISKEKTDLLIFTGSAAYPAGIAENLKVYLGTGGNLMTLGGPAFTVPYRKTAEGWTPVTDTGMDILDGKIEGKVYYNSFEKKGDAFGWHHSADGKVPGSKMEPGDFGSKYGGAVHIAIRGLKGWDNFSRSIKMPAEHNTLAMYAKGSEVTPSICVEITEKDGSRWIATVNLDTEWAPVTMRTEDFKFWYADPSTGRGGNGDRVRFGNAGSLSVGIAHSHCTVASDDCDFWIDQITSARIEGREEVMPVLDTVTPEFMNFPITNGKKVCAYSDQTVVSDVKFKLPAESFSCSPRPQGTGFMKKRSKRFIPLIEVYDEKGLLSGSLAWMRVNSGMSDERDPYEGSIFAAFGTDDPAFYDENGAGAVGQTAARILDGAFLAEAGADEYIYMKDAGTPVTIGAVVTDRAEVNGLCVNIELTRKKKAFETRSFLTDDASFSFKRGDGGAYKVMKYEYTPEQREDFTVTATLMRGEKVLDVLKHDVRFWEPKPEDEREFVTVRDGVYYKGDKPLFLMGVNYMPSSGIAMTREWHNYEYYVSRSAYDPYVFENDIKRLKEVGFNAVSIFDYYGPMMQSANILHLIDLCEQYGIYVDLALRPHANPLDFNAGEVQEMITKYRLDLNDNIVAYDIAWERSFGNYEPSYGNVLGRKGYDADWEKWVLDQYGSIEAAEKDWDCAVNRSGSGKVIGVTDDQLRYDGKHTKMVAAYRRFADDFISSKHVYAKETIREVDPNHLVSFRSGADSSIPLVDPGVFGYDYQSIASSMDFFSPESYAIRNNEKSMRQMLYTNAYARYVSPGTAIAWKEFGMSIWQGSNFGENRTEAEQADYYRNFLDKAMQGHSAANYCWWYAGGYRVNENSDYGILNPDGSDREVTKVLREYAPKFIGQKLPPKATLMLSLNRDESVTGIKHLYESGEEAFFKAMDEGGFAALTDDGRGKTSADVPLIAVGGGEYNENPLRYLNGEFRRIWYKCGEEWVRVDNGGVILAEKDKPIELRLSVGNTQSAKWLAGKKEGSVLVRSMQDSDAALELELPGDLDYLGTAEVTGTCEAFRKDGMLTFRFEALNRCIFGEYVRLQVCVG